MNHLAHALLAAPEPAPRLGNLFGDAVRGPLSRQDLPAGVLDGVKAHRRIDAMTDRHPDTLHMRGLFPDALRRYAGIILDLAFDHYLVRQWPQFCEISRRSFTLEVYGAMQHYPALLPPSIRAVAPEMIARDFLNRCETVGGLTSALTHIDRRLSRGFDVELARQTLLAHDATFQRGFESVYSDVRAALVSSQQLSGQAPA